MFDKARSFSSLSVKDLLEAREAYHVHLAHLENVVATAVGRYRTRKDPKDDGPKRLDNTEVREGAWPCVLVFVNSWIPQAEFAKKYDDIVPSRLHMPDGRTVPTCVIYAPRDERAETPIDKLRFPAGLVGGGYPVLTDVQGVEHVGSLGCLVTDGDSVYALTNRHVVGEPGRAVFTVVHGQRQQIGVTHDKQTGKLPFTSAYRGYPGERTFANLDAGLVRIADMREWTAQVFGVGEVDHLVDLNVDTISLDLVGCPVRAFGAASGELEGEIQGLFYRYKSVGGFDYVADLLIGPRKDVAALTTRPGDSGTIWFFDPAKESKRDKARAPQLRPVAMQWGGHSFLDLGSQAGMRFALASCLSTVCRELDVELVRDWDIGVSEYWGKVGHYKVAALACLLVGGEVAPLMKANQLRISVADDNIRSGELPMNNQKEFVALADVPDLIWRSKRKMDEANHFADMDQPGSDGRTLLQLWADHPESRTPAAWTEFYDGREKIEGAKILDKHRGALPFRVWQMYEAMVGFAERGEIAEFVAAAGTVAHFVGDACQPLHVSWLHHGRPGHDEEDVHSIYETKMLDQRAAELLDVISGILGETPAPESATFKSGAKAADEVVQLMGATIQLIPPEEVIDAYNAEEGRKRIDHMWTALGERTAETIINGARTLARIWASAWKEGRGRAEAKPVSKAALEEPVPEERLMELYNDRDFVESKWLRDLTAEDLPGLK